MQKNLRQKNKKSDFTKFFIEHLLLFFNNTQKKGSDIDVVIICDDSFEPKRIYAELKQDCELNIPPIHLYVFKKVEFINMLLNKEANYGKEISNKNLILFGAEEYYNLISGAIKNGFRG